MTATVSGRPQAVDYEGQRRAARSAQNLWLVAVAAAVVAVTGVALFQNERFSLGTLVLAAVLVVCVVRPLAGLYSVVFLASVGDPAITTWYPFVKNFSMSDSLLYLDDRLILSPLEIAIAALAVGWLLQMWGARSWTVVRGRLLAPLLVFSGFVVVGLLYGLASGGNLNVALWEARTLLYLPVVYLFVANLGRGDRRVLERLWWVAAVGILINGLAAFQHWRGLTPAERDGLERLVTHSLAVPMHVVLLMVIAAWLFRPSPAWVRFGMPILGFPMVVAYLVSERRAAIAGLFVALAMTFVVLWWTRRRLFLVVAPLAAVLAIGYLAAFWNGSGPAAAPALAAKTILAPDQLDEADAGSDLYRVIENANISFTIETSPLLGVGFGKPFLRPYTLPDINPFLLAQYLPHNSLLWIWLKTGALGFVAFLYLVAMAMRRGAAACVRSDGTRQLYVVVTAVGYVASLLVFTYGDIAWDAPNMVLMALALAHVDLAAGGRRGSAGEAAASDAAAPDPDGPTPDRPLAISSTSTPHTPSEVHP